jgi:hypothetical protein
MSTKMFRASLTAEFPYDSTESPMELAAKVEAAMKRGAEVVKGIDEGAVAVTLNTAFVNVREKKAPAPVQAPAGVEIVTAETKADDGQTELTEAVAAAGGNPGGFGKGPAVFPPIGGARPVVVGA